MLVAPVRTAVRSGYDPLMPPAPATNVLPRMTRLEYLEFEEASEEKHEWHDGEVLAMSGGMFSHAVIATDANRAIGRRLEDGPCDVIDSNMRVWLDAARRYVYPDGLVYCGEPEFDETDGKRTTLLNPTVIIEVLSDSTKAYERGEKFAAYRAVPSLREYVLIEQDRPQVEVYFRHGDGSWRFDAYEGLDAVATLRSVNVDLPLREVYRRALDATS